MCHMIQTMVFNLVIERAHKMASSVTKPMNHFHSVMCHEKDLYYLFPQKEKKFGSKLSLTCFVQIASDELHRLVGRYGTKL